MLSPASAHTYAGGTAPSVQPGTLPPESLAPESPSGIREDPLYSPGPAVVIGLSAEVKGQLDVRSHGGQAVFAASLAFLHPQNFGP